MSNPILTQDDVTRLLEDPSPEHRAETALKVAEAFDPDVLSESERSIAEEIFKVMVADAEVRVRQALAVNIKENPFLPHDIALALASDVDEVALPILSSSEVLTDADLIDLLSSGSEDRLVAIAGRKTVSESVADALVGTGNVSAVAELVSNEGAELSEGTLNTVIDRFGDNEAVQESMVGRSVLPITIAERLVTVVSERLQAELVTKHELPDGVAADLIMQSRERATIGLSSDSDESSVAELVDQLADNERLTPSIILRAVCMGDLTFFEHSMAKRVGISVANARRLIHDPGRLGLSGIFEKAGMPDSFYPAVRAALDVAAQTEYDGGENDRERFARRMIERILTQYGEFGVEMEDGDLEYLLAKMNKLPADNLVA